MKKRAKDKLAAEAAFASEARDKRFRCHAPDGIDVAAYPEASHFRTMKKKGHNRVVVMAFPTETGLLALLAKHPRAKRI